MCWRIKGSVFSDSSGNGSGHQKGEEWRLIATEILHNISNSCLIVSAHLKCGTHFHRPWPEEGDHEQQNGTLWLKYSDVERIHHWWPCGCFPSLRCERVENVLAGGGKRWEVKPLWSIFSLSALHTDARLSGDEQQFHVLQINMKLTWSPDQLQRWETHSCAFAFSARMLMIGAASLMIEHI